MRTVSLLPSTTEILFALGAGAQVVGVTFDCDYPVEARTRRIVSTTAIPEGLPPSEIDAFVSQAMAAGEDLYHLDAGALAELDADLVVTQDLCAVCAVDVSKVDDALDYLGCRAEVLTSITTLGDATGTRDRADEIVADLRQRLSRVAKAVAGQRMPRALVLEWTDPPFAPGHWVPEMVAAAGGSNALGGPGEKSARTTWDAVRASTPDVIVAAPCGYHLDGAAALAQKAIDDGNLPAGIPVWAVDANASFARPGPRLVDGVEALAGIFHPGTAEAPSPEMARRLR